MRKYYLILILCLYFSATAHSEPNMELKLYDPKDNLIINLASFEGGRLWLLKDLNQIVYYRDEQIRIFSINGNKLSEVSLYKVEDDNLRKLAGPDSPYVKSKKPKNSIAFYWDIPYRAEEISSFTIDEDNILIISDKTGDLYFYDLPDREYLGKLTFAKGDIASLDALKKGSLLITYKNGGVLFLEKVKLPVISFFQTLRDTYRQVAEVNLGASDIRFIDGSEREDKFYLITGHKNISLYSIPALNIIASFKEDKFIDYAASLGDKLLYSSMEEAKIEGNFSFHKHLTVLSKFYEKKKNIVFSKRGNRFSYVSSLSSIRVYDIPSERMIGEIGINVKDIERISFSPDEKYLVIITDRKKISVYRMY